MNRPTNKDIVAKYLRHFEYSEQSVKMRKSSLNYFFEETIYDNKTEILIDSFNYKKHIFDITTQDLIKYFEFLNTLKNIGLTTKKAKWAIIKSFLSFCMEYYRDFNFIVMIPKNSIKWQNNHKKAESNKNIIADIEEIKIILDYMKQNNYKHFIMFKLLIETGMRLGELLSIQLKDINIKKRFVNCRGKTGEKTYYFSQELALDLKLYVPERSNIKNIKTNSLFLNTNLKPYSNRSIQIIVNKVLKSLKIEKKITPHTFRRTLNTLRKRMGCDNDTAKMLLGHKLNDVNIESYTVFNYEDYIKLFDKFNPYQF